MSKKYSILKTGLTVLLATLMVGAVVNATTTVGDNVSVGGTLGVTGATTLSSTLAVTGISTLTGLLNANGGIAVDTDNFTVSGTTGALSLTSSATAGNLAYITLDAAAMTAQTSGLTIDMSPITGGAFDASGLAIIGDADGSGTALGIALDGTMDYGISIASATINTADMILSNSATIDNTTDGTLTITEPIVAISGNGTVSGTLGVTGATTLTGVLYANGGIDRLTAGALAIGASTSTSVAIGGAVTTGDIAIGAAQTTGLLTLGKSTEEAIQIGGYDGGGTTLYSIILAPKASVVTGGITQNHLVQITDPSGGSLFGDVSGGPTYGLVASFDRSDATTGDLSGTDTGFDMRVANDATNDSTYDLQGAYIKAKNEGTVDVLKGLFVEALNDQTGGIATTVIGVDIGVDSNGAETTATGLNIRNSGASAFTDISLQNGETISNATNGQIAFVSDAGTITGEQHGIDLTYTGTLSSGDSMVGINSVVTPAGNTGNWISGVYGKVAQTTGTHAGYISGGEFEVNNTSADAQNEMFPLVLDSSNIRTYHANSAYIWMQDFGPTGEAQEMPNLLKITGATSNTGNMFLADVPGTLGASLRIMVNGTPYYIGLYTAQND